MASEKWWILYAVSLYGRVRVKAQQKSRSFLQSVGKKNRYRLRERAKQMDDNVWFYRLIYAEGSSHS